MLCSDYPSVNENAADPPLENEKDQLNTPSALSLEATYINQNFAFQVVREDNESRVDLEHPNPFYSSDETEPLASCGYRYRKFDLSVTEDEDVSIIVRTEVDSFIKATGADTEDTFITVKILNEFDSRSQGSGGAPDWRSKLDSQRGAVVATEMKNNSNKLSRWAVQSILAGAEQMKMGSVPSLAVVCILSTSDWLTRPLARSDTLLESTLETHLVTPFSVLNGTNPATLLRR